MLLFQAMGSIDAATCASPADMIFKMRSLRSFLKNPGVHCQEHAEASFVKASNFLHRPPSRVAQALPVRPFHSSEAAQDKPWQSMRDRSQASNANQLQQFPLRKIQRPRLGADGYKSMADPLPIGFSQINMPATGSASRGALRKRQVRRSVSSHSDMQEDPAFIDFPEEPEDPRVRLPAHRIGDVLPSSTESPVFLEKPVVQMPARTGKGSQSMPTLHILARGLHAPQKRPHNIATENIGVATVSRKRVPLRSPTSQDGVRTQITPSFLEFLNQSPDQAESTKQLLSCADSPSSAGCGAQMGGSWDFPDSPESAAGTEPLDPS